MTSYIKKFLFILFAIILTTISKYQAFADCACDYAITPNNNYLNANNTNIPPGSTICIQSGTYDFIRFDNLAGTEDQKIQIINCGGEVFIQRDSWGMVATSSKHFRISGTGHPGLKYGFRITTGGTAIAIGESSTDFEIDHIKFLDVDLALHILTKLTCDPSSWRENFTIKNVSVHDNFVDGAEGEGFYIGHSWYIGKTFTCDGKQIKVYPQNMENVKVFNNIIKNTGWDGFQVSCAVKNCEIYNNTIENFGLKNKNTQRAGIVIGGGTAAKVYNNRINNGMGGGIHIFGLGNTTLFNNIISNAGEDGIFFSDKTTEPGNYFWFFNNTIVNSTRDGIRSYSDISKNNLFHNNIIINPGSINDYGNPDKAFINLSNNNNHTSSNNYFSENFNEIKFVDHIQNDFRLQESSPVIDQGKNLQAEGVTFDLENISRPQGNGWDIGAHEFTLLTGLEIINKNNMVFPNPFSSQIAINTHDYLLSNETLHLQILDIHNKVYFTKNISIFDNSENSYIKINTQDLPCGIYFVTIDTNNYTSTTRIIKR